MTTSEKEAGRLKVARDKLARQKERATPTPAAIKAARERYGLTQTEAAELIYCTPNAWQRWEYGTRTMEPAFWGYFKLRAAAARRKRK